IAVERGFCEERNGVAENAREILESRIPVIESDAVNCAGHAVLVEIGAHVNAEGVEPTHLNRLDIGRNRLDEWRNENTSGERRGLVLGVKHFGIPLKFLRSDLL